MCATISYSNIAFMILPLQKAMIVNRKITSLVSCGVALQATLHYIHNTLQVCKKRDIVFNSSAIKINAMIARDIPRHNSREFL